MKRKLFVFLCICFFSLQAYSQKSGLCKASHKRFSNLEKQVIKRYMPYYPQKPGVSLSRTVIVKIEVDENGEVTTAEPICGHSTLQQSSTAAARNWKFSQRQNNTKMKKRVGIIIFDYPPIPSF